MDSNETSNSGKNLSWKQGKRLGEVEFVVDGNVTKAYSYYYDESGRIKKIDQGSGNYIKYHYDSDNLEYEEHYANNSLSYLIKYFYDDQDRVQFALYKNQNFSTSYGYYNLYTYVYNGIGEITDIVKVRNGLSPSASSISNLPVAHYEYDPYGNIVSINTYNDDTFGNINPIRYKAYYYDTDLGWYNLGSRYYDPSVGRFINCDSIGIINNNASDIENKNLYAYCNNNPVMYYDDGGDIPVIVVAALFSGILNCALDYACAVIEGEAENYTWQMGAAAFASGAISVFGIPGAAASVGIDFYSNTQLKNESAGVALLESTVDIICIAKALKLTKTAKGIFKIKDKTGNDIANELTHDWGVGSLQMGGSAIKTYAPERNKKAKAAKLSRKSRKVHALKALKLKKIMKKRIRNRKR